MHEIDRKKCTHMCDSKSIYTKKENAGVWKFIPSNEEIGN